MAKSKNSLQAILSKITPNTYFTPGANVTMKYPAIVYTYDSSESSYADNTKFIDHRRYTITLISQTFDETMIDEILKLPYTTLETSYVVDNLRHYQVTIYY